MRPSLALSTEMVFTELFLHACQRAWTSEYRDAKGAWLWGFVSNRRSSLSQHSYIAKRSDRQAQGDGLGSTQQGSGKVWASSGRDFRTVKEQQLETGQGQSRHT